MTQAKPAPLRRLLDLRRIREAVAENEGRPVVKVDDRLVAADVPGQRLHHGVGVLVRVRPRVGEAAVERSGLEEELDAQRRGRAHGGAQLEHRCGAASCSLACECDGGGGAGVVGDLGEDLGEEGLEGLGDGAVDVVDAGGELDRLDAA